MPLDAIESRVFPRRKFEKSLSRSPSPLKVEPAEACAVWRWQLCQRSGACCVY
jgi:hypothetical protein